MSGDGLGWSEALRVLLLAWAVVLPAWAVWPWLGGLRESFCGKAGLAVALGTGLLLTGQFALGLAGLGVDVRSGCVLLSLIWVTGAWRRRQARKNSAGEYPKAVSKPWHWLDVGAALLGAGMLCCTVRAVWAEPIHGIPDCGVWGQKARFMVEQRDLPWELWRDEGRPYLHRDYPLGWSQYLAWVEGWMPWEGWRTIRLLPVLVMAVALLELRALLAGAFALGAARAAMSAAVAASGSLVVVFGMISSLYAEPLLALLVLAGWRQGVRAWEDGGVQLEAERCWCWSCGGLLLGLAAWVKQEGLLLLGLSALLWGIAAWRRQDWRGWRRAALGALLALLLSWVPWFFIRVRLGLTGVDFGGAADWDKALTALRWLGKNLTHAEGLGPLMWAAAVATGWCFYRCWRYRQERLWRLAGLLLSVLHIVFYLVLFAWSQRDLDWHLNALERVLWLPFLLLCAWQVLRVPGTPGGRSPLLSEKDQD